MKLIYFFIMTLGILFLIAGVHASINDIKYPVPELGNCNSQVECEKYCDDSANMEICLDVAEKYQLMGANEIAEARKIIPYLKSGQTPGACKNKNECEEYCSNDQNLDECINFGIKIGEIKQEEAEMIKKTGGKGPGNCRGKEECDKYCEDESHINECIDFAVKYGLMPAQEAELAKKTGGKGPGNCRGKEECDSYCKDESHIEECIEFSIKYGLMKPEDAERMRKTGGKSPGNCKSEEECTKFCNSEEGKPICLEFEHEYGLITEEKYQEYKNGDKNKKKGNLPCEGEEECKKWCEESEENQIKCNEDAFQNGFISEEQYNQNKYDMSHKSEREQQEREEKERQLEDMKKQWAEEESQHEAQYGPGSQQVQNPDNTANSDSQDSGNSGGNSEEGGSDSGSNEASGETAVTGSVIGNGEIENWISKSLKYILDKIASLI